jgi:hypothetical protein
MDEQTKKLLEKYAPSDPLWYGEQDENGTDLSLIRYNLSLSPEERLLQGDRACDSTLRLMEYGRRQRERGAKSKPSV